VPSVLVVDDEPEVRDSIRQVLTRVGFSVVTANDGAAGIEAFHNQPPDVVIVDIIMPHGNGVEVIKKIRASYPGARILAITGGGNFGPSGYKPWAVVTEAYLASATESGADAVMRKPFYRADLIAAVRGLVKN
jgi:two-component system chemotaxis response regulator CheY